MCCKGGRETFNQLQQREAADCVGISGLNVSDVPSGGFGLDVWPPAQRIHNDWENLGRLKESFFFWFQNCGNTQDMWHAWENPAYL